MMLILGLTLAIPASWALLLGAERVLGGGRDFPTVRGWTFFGLVAFLVSGAVSAVVPSLASPLLSGLRLIDLSSTHLWGAAPAVLLTTFFTYWSHRIQHRFDSLWRLGHQVHHSVARVDVASSMMFHPTDVAIQASLAALAAAILGLTPEAAALAGLAGFMLAVFQHWNVPTPHWLGYFIQRPEAHCLHHERDVHSRNFGDLPLWDMLFGTFANPARCQVEVGFAPDAGKRLLSMLLFVDVNRRLARAKP